MVDFHTPGGVDRDGWQYAVDFPASYHAKKNFTDYVRRRRWSVACSIQMSLFPEYCEENKNNKSIFQVQKVSSHN